VRDQSLLFSCLLSESRNRMIKRLHGLEICEIHQSVKSVIQIIYCNHFFMLVIKIIINYKFIVLINTIISVLKPAHKMKHYFTFLFLLCSIAFSATAQINYTEKFKKELAAHPAEDTFRVNRLNEMSLGTDLSRAERKKISTEALAISEKIGYKMGKAMALSNLGMLQQQQGNTAQGVKMMNEAEAISDKMDDPGLKVFILSRKGIIPNSPNSLQYNLEGEKIATEIGNQRLLATIESVIGSYYFNTLIDYPKSLEYSLKGLAAAEQANDLGAKISIWRNLGTLYAILGDQDKALQYFREASKANKLLGSNSIESFLQNALGESYRLSGKYAEAIEAYKLSNQLTTRGDSHYVNESNLADVYTRMDSLPQAFAYGFNSLDSARKASDSTQLAWVYGILSRASLKSNRADSAIYYAKLGLTSANQSNNLEYLRDNNLALANAYAAKKDFGDAYNYHLQYIAYRDSILSGEVRNKTSLLTYNIQLGKKEVEIAALGQQKKDQQKILYSIAAVLLLILLSAVLLWRNNRQKQRANTLLQKQKEEIDSKASNVELLGEIGRKITSSLSVEPIISTAYDNVNSLMDASVFGIGIYHDDTKALQFPATYENGQALPAYSIPINQKKRFAVLCFNRKEEFIIGDLENEYKDYMQHMPNRASSNLPASLIYLPLKVKDKILGVVTVQSFQQHAYSEYHLFMLRNIAIYAAIALENAESYKKLNLTINSLKQTQTQLVQAEKMASLGQLTAGIAHEIQNPLNFVNNFSEVSNELIDEMNIELNKGDIEEAKAIAVIVKQNLEKINHHGKRADGIVKGMLQHSRSSNGVKEPTDINALCDEYLRLSYHGLRAKDKSFNATIKTDFDTSLEKITIIPQDIGRVILNLLTNAFYVVDEKKKSGLAGYEPTVTISTSRSLSEGEGWGEVILKVADNGNGIPQKVLDKIFQPFFTTKPTGQGTGLGLSLSYDIVKAHGGELKVETKEGEGSTFIIHLPI
jgi:signal transduction histidine kinase